MSNEKINKEETLLFAQMYKNLFARVKGLIVKPAKAWEDILAERSSVNDVLMQFSLPLIGAYSLAEFLGRLFGYRELDFASSLKLAVFVFSACFFGLYLGYFLLLKLITWRGVTNEKEVVFKLMAYPSMPIYLLGIITALIPQTIFFYFLVMYSVYIVWEGLKAVNVTPEKRGWQTLTVSMMVLMLPYLLNKLLIYLSQFAL